VAGRRLDRLSRKELAGYRARDIGIIFQSFNLLAHHTALGNVEMGLYFDRTPRHVRREKALSALKRVGLEDRAHHRPLELSGGEQQRAAIARALAKNPRILFADEPTGNLDQDNAEDIADILKDLHREGMTVVLITHDLAMAERLATRAVHLHYGRMQ
jgi:putative ABC transport system ATP-binding protein